MRYTPKLILMLSTLLCWLLGTCPVEGQVRVLYQNDLSTAATKSALFLPKAVIGTDASSVCSVYSETPLASVTNDIRDQLRYLLYTGDLDSSSKLWLASSGNTCKAYSLSTNTVLTTSCSTKLPVLCNNSPPPYNLANLEAAQGSHVFARKTGVSITGYRDARSFRFLGIPYATPPIGTLRFAAAQPYTGVYQDYNALRFGAPCIQTASPFGLYDNSQVSENCLFLNVFTPILPTTTSSGKTLPVAVWFYGGAFQVGDTEMMVYDGGNMASRGDVVVVTVNYRLGVLGNMASDTLQGSQGVSDQIQALKWVQNNIDIFGGDPQRVTIFGQSAGAQSVIALMSSTPAKGLFSAAIAQSAPWVPFPNKQVYTSYLYPSLLQATGCSSQTTSASKLNCLRNLPASTFISDNVETAILGAATLGMDAYAEVKQISVSAETLLPVVGTGLIDGLAVELIQKGRLPSAGIALMIGNTRDEGALFVSSVPGLAQPVPASDDLLAYLLSLALDDNSLAAVLANRDVFAFDQSNPDALRTLAGSIETWDVWQCPLQEILRLAKTKQTFSSLYSFRFDKGIFTEGLPDMCGPSAPSGVQAVCHAEDVSAVFGNLNLWGSYDSINSLPFTQYVMDTWTSFMRTNNPQPAAQYLQARGRSYETTLSYSLAAPFSAYSPYGSNAIQLLDLPPRQSPIVEMEECEILEAAGFSYDNVA